MERQEWGETKHAQYLVTRVEGLRKAVKWVRALTTEAASQQEQYGRSLLKASRSFLQSLERLSGSSRLLQTLHQLGSHYDSVGSLYIQLTTQVPSTDLEDSIYLRKQVFDDLQVSIKDAVTAKNSLVKAKNKYERVCREGSQDKLKSPGQHLVKQNAENALKDTLDAVSGKQKALNEGLQACNEAVQSAELRTLETGLKLLRSFVQMNERVVTLRIEFPQLASPEFLSGISLDLISPLSPRSSYPQSVADRLNAKLNFVNSAMEERKTALKILKNLIGELILAEENAGRGLAKVLNSYLNLQSPLSEKNRFKQVWENFVKLLELLISLHNNRFKTLSQHCTSLLTSTIASLNQLQKDTISQGNRTIKDHLQLEEECLRDFDRLKRTSDDVLLQEMSQNVSEKMQISAENTEKQVRGVILEGNNTEGKVIQGVKKVLLTLISLEMENGMTLIRKILGIIDGVEIWKDVDALKLPQQGEIMALEQIKTEVASKLTVTEPAEEQATPRNQDKELAKFGLPSETQLVESFSCAFVKKIALQGRLYLCTSHLCFHSYFNSSTIFGRETVFIVPLTDIIRVEKRTYAFLFDNAIAVKTKEMELLFASFIARDQALTTLTCLLQLQPEAAHSQDDYSLDSPEKPRLGLTRLMRGTKKGKKSKEDILREVTPQTFFKYQVIKRMEFNATLAEVFIALFESNETWKRYYDSRHDTNVVITPWTPSPPVYYGGANTSWPTSSTRDHDFTHPVKVRAPMIPATCTCKESYEVFFLSETELLIEVKVKVDSVPFADYFSTRTRWSLEEIDGRTYLDLYYGMHFHKDTWFQSRIEKSGLDEFSENITTHWIPLSQQIMQSRQSTERLIPVTERLIEREIRIETELPWYVPVLFGLIVLLFTVVVWRLWVRILALEKTVNDLLEV